MQNERKNRRASSKNKWSLNNSNSIPCILQSSLLSTKIIYCNNKIICQVYICCNILEIIIVVINYLLQVMTTTKICISITIII